MGKNESLMKTAFISSKICQYLNIERQGFTVYRSKGLLEHLKKRNHYSVIEYIDNLSMIIGNPDYVGGDCNKIELVKQLKKNVFVCIKLDEKKKKYYVASMFEIKEDKVIKYVQSGRLIPIIEILTNYTE